MSNWRLTANAIVDVIQNGRFDLVSVGEVNGIPVVATFEDAVTGRYVEITITETEYEEEEESDVDL